MMTRVLLAVTILSCALIPMILSADPPESSSSQATASADANPIYLKVIWPVDPATPVIETDRLVIESWITKSIEDQHQSHFRAVTGWVPLVEDRFESTDLWDGKLDIEVDGLDGKVDGKFNGLERACHAHAYVQERKDGWIKLSISGWSPGVAYATVTLKDEPGSREVVPITDAKKKHGTPHVAIFVGLPVKK